LIKLGSNFDSPFLSKKPKKNDYQEFRDVQPFPHALFGALVLTFFPKKKKKNSVLWKKRPR